MQKSLWNIAKPADVVYTPRYVSKHIIEHLNPTGLCLDPCRGDGAFFDFLPRSSRDYCEITEGSDFFEYKEEVDWVIGNPPYSDFEHFLRHSFDIARDVSFIVPTNKVFQRQVIMDLINNWGGIKSIIVYGNGTKIDFPFGFSVGNFHFKKDYQGSTEIVMGLKKIFKSDAISAA